MSWFLTERILRGKNNENGLFIDSLIIGSAILNKVVFNQLIPINKIYIIEIETRADEFAVRNITSDLDSAIRCLRHLCNNDLQRESHIWEYQHPFKIMTMDERMIELIKRITKT